MKVWKRTLAWLAVAGWMVVIFAFSAQTGNRSGNTSGEIVRWIIGLFYRGFADLPQAKQAEVLELLHLVIRKGAHFTEYAVLAMLTANALRGYQISTVLGWCAPVAFSALYAATDEIHQYFVPDRACRLLDVGIDTAGALFGTAIFMLLGVIVKRISRFS